MAWHLRTSLALALVISILFVGIAAPGAHPPKEMKLRFAVIGDTGTGDEPQLAVARQMVAEYERERYELVLMLGDNIYGGGFNKIAKVFEIPYAKLLDSGVKFYAALGNHDQVSADQQITYSKFNMGKRRWYSFKPEGDLVEFFALDSTPLLSGRLLEQMEWLDKELAQSKAKWKIAFFHHPPYSPGRRHGDNPIMLSRVVPVLKRHKVRVVLTGHEHFFAKLRPQDGIDYIISGSGGKIHRGGLRTDHPNLEAGNDQLHHFLIVTLTEESFAYAAIAGTGEVIHHGSFPLRP
jgi:3',5'-cyclic AMP phosphodiesterase CpdA